MAANLPPEILCIIASHLDAIKQRNWRLSKGMPKVGLAPCTVVCPAWQAPFERMIYPKCRRLASSEYQIGPKRASRTLDKFYRVTSGAPYRLARRSMIKTLEYLVILPHYLPDYQAATLDGYDPENYMRQVNDRAFSKGIQDLFEMLQSWPPDSNLSLTIGVWPPSLNEEKEPETRPESAGDHSSDFMDGSIRAVLPYRARLVDVSILPRLSCVKSVSFKGDMTLRRQLDLADRKDMPLLDGVSLVEDLCEQNVWIGSGLQIVQHMTSVTDVLFKTYSDFIRPDQKHAMQHRREVFAKGLKGLPNTIERFTCYFSDEGHWAWNIDGPRILPPSGKDDLSISLRGLSQQLRVFHLFAARLTSEIFWPSKLSTKEPMWPYMEIYELSAIRPVKPDGTWWVFPSDPGSYSYR